VLFEGDTGRVSESRAHTWDQMCLVLADSWSRVVVEAIGQGNGGSDGAWVLWANLAGFANWLALRDATRPHSLVALNAARRSTSMQH
jgi:hypothetical protein